MKRVLLSVALVAFALPAGAQSLDQNPGMTVTGGASQRFQALYVELTAPVSGHVPADGLRAALTAAGMTAVGVGPGDQLTDHSSLRGAIDHVTPAKVARVMAAVADYTRAHPDVTVGTFAFRAPWNGCSVIEQTVRAQAIADTKRRADDLAQRTGVVLGPVLAIHETGGCPAESKDSGRTPVDPSTLTITLDIQEQMTFAIADKAS